MKTKHKKNRCKRNKEQNDESSNRDNILEESSLSDNISERED